MPTIRALGQNLAFARRSLRQEAGLTILVVTTLAFGIGTSTATDASAQLKFVSLDIRVPVPPTPFVADGKTHLVYELRITNLDRGQLTVSAIDVYADSSRNPLVTRSGGELETDASFAGAPASGNPLALPTGRQTLVYLWVTLPGGTAAPAMLRHRLTVLVTDSSGKAKTDTVGRFLVPVHAAAPLVLSAPFTAGPWVALDGPSNTSGHRRSAVPLNGQARIGERFATDWVKLGTDGRAFHGDSLVNRNWYGYGTPVFAVADGIVTQTKDGIIENVPFLPTMAVPITLETVGGNHVILDVGAGHYAFYAHLQPGSLKVKLGEKVRRGQPIGSLGNSGHSTAPHLHFQVTDGNSPLGSEGLPWVWDRFEQLDWLKPGFEALVGRLLGGWHPSAPPTPKRNQATLENMIVRFP